MINEEKIIWKQYPDCPFIEANQFGEIRTKDHWVTCKNGSKRLIKGQVLKQQLNKNGYMQVQTHINGKHIVLYVHRIMAACFLPNPNGYPEVNHIDNDSTNNKLDNLEWCTPGYNIAYREKYGTSAKEAARVLRKPVIAVNQETSEVLWFESQHEAARQLGVSVGHVNHVIKGQYRQTGGYWFCYADNNAVEKARIKFGDEVASKVEELMKGD